jgi:hypothetical protein
LGEFSHPYVPHPPISRQQTRWNELRQCSQLRTSSPTATFVWQIAQTLPAMERLARISGGSWKDRCTSPACGGNGVVVSADLIVGAGGVSCRLAAASPGI